MADLAIVKRAPLPRAGAVRPGARDDREALRGFGKGRAGVVRNIARAGQRPDLFTAAVLLAVGLRETYLQNIVGDYGHGRGVFQQDDRWQAEWLGDHRGCKSGTWRTVYESALPAGRVPSLSAGCRRTRELLEQNVAFGNAHGVAAKDLRRFAIASYNAGPGNALLGYHEGDVDRYTAGGDYSEDVLERRLPVARNWIKRNLA